MFRVLAALGVALVAALVSWAVMVEAAAWAGRLSWAAGSALDAAATGAAVLVAGLVRLMWHRRWRNVVAVALALATGAATVAAIGTRNLTTMAAGVRSGCAAGLGRCQPTDRPKMPLLLDTGPVQAHPVIRVITWGIDGREGAAVARAEAAAPSLGQPLLRDYYRVGPAVPGGAWAAPWDPVAWLHHRHERALTAADLLYVIGRARAANHWPDTSDTQYWLATDLTAGQIGIGAGACADHVRLPGLLGSVVRLPFGSCTLPAKRPGTTPGSGCRPLAVVQPAVRTPATVEAGVEIFIGHEFAEAATDPSEGWSVLVASRCHGDPLLEIADVCEPDSSFISAPAWDTASGWQPSLLEPAGAGRPARCVDPARPDPAGHR